MDMFFSLNKYWQVRIGKSVFLFVSPIIKTVLIIVFAAIPALAQEHRPAAPRVYYVSNSGSNLNSGTINAPFQNINTALGHTLAGDTVLVRGGTYYEKVSIPNSGTKDKYITLKAYPGEKPIIDGSKVIINGREAMVTVNMANFIVVDGLTVCNLKTITGDPKGIMVEGGSDYITIKNNEVYGIDYTKSPLDGGSNGILIIGNTNDPVTNITVTGNTIHDCKTGYSENLTINGYVDGFTITNNTIYNAENIGIDAAGGYSANPNPALNYARNGLISGNTCYHIEGKRGPVGGYGAIGIYADGSRNVLIEKNRIYMADRGIGAVSETNEFPTDSITIRNNLVYNCWRAGIYIGGYLNYTGGGTANAIIVNNTLFNNNQVLGAFGEIEGEISIRENCSHNLIANNVIYGGTADMFIHKYTSTGGNNTIDHNLYFTTGTSRWIWNGSEYTDFNAWKTASNCDAGSTNGIDPLFVSTTLPDLHIQPLSPAKNSGLVISKAVNGGTDMDGKQRMLKSKISKGAYQ